MPTPLHITNDLPGSPSKVFDLFVDEVFLAGRLENTGGLDPQVVGVTKDGETVTVVTRQAIPSSVLPSMVASMIPGNPMTERTETWAPSGDGFQATFAVVIKGAPASLKGTMNLQPKGEGSELVVEGRAAVPVPLFGGKVESIVVEYVGTMLNEEAEYTTSKL